MSRYGLRFMNIYCAMGLGKSGGKWSCARSDKKGELAYNIGLSCSQILQPLSPVFPSCIVEWSVPALVLQDPKCGRYNLHQDVHDIGVGLCCPGGIVTDSASKVIADLHTDLGFIDQELDNPDIPSSTSHMDQGFTEAVAGIKGLSFFVKSSHFLQIASSYCMGHFHIIDFFRRDKLG